MKNNKMIIKRLVIYCVLSFLPLIIVVPIINHMLGVKLFVAYGYEGIINVVGVFGMLLPAIAHLLTRLITKEGFEDTYLKLNIKGNAKYYIASFGVKIIETFIIIILIWRILLPEFTFKEIFMGNRAGTGFAIIFMQFAATLILILPFFGEEWGWRGYMMPKLLEITSKPKAIIIGGVIWGLWHAPLTVSGHNFGVDYPGFPFVGIILMCVYCISMNAFLTLITERTKSILPACICHGVNNNMGATLIMTLLTSQNALNKLSAQSAFKMSLLLLPTGIIVGVTSMIIFCKRKK